MNRKSGRVQWNKPRTFFGTSFEVPDYPKIEAKDLSPMEAARMIQSAVRGYMAR